MKNLKPKLNFIKEYNELDPFNEEIPDFERPNPGDVKLKGFKKSVFFLDCGDLENFVREVYGYGPRDYEFASIQEANNDSFYLFSASKKIEHWDKNDADKIRNGEEINSNYLLFDVLCADGYIEPGDYLVEVCW